VLHPAELERRDQHEVELAERIRNAGVILEPLERVSVQIENRLTIAGDLRGVGLTMEHAETSALALGGLDVELAGRERKQIRRNRLRLLEHEPDFVGHVDVPDFLAVRHRLPSGGRFRLSCQRAFRSGWSKQGIARDARAGTKSE
jgi:hypothetical protein